MFMSNIGHTWTWNKPKMSQACYNGVHITDFLMSIPCLANKTEEKEIINWIF